MQFKTLGESLNAIQVIKSTLNDKSIHSSKIDTILAKELAPYSIDALKNAAIQTTLDKTSIQTILSRRDLPDDQIQALSESWAEAAAAQTKAGKSAAGLKETYTGLAASIGLSATQLTAFLDVTAAVGIGVSIYKAYKQQQEENLRAAQEAAATYSSSAQSLDTYLARYQELQTALQAAKGNEDETYQLKKQLLELQNELNAAYYPKIGILKEVLLRD